jgi:hypothetical protein
MLTVHPIEEQLNNNQLDPTTVRRSNRESKPSRLLREDMWVMMQTKLEKHVSTFVDPTTVRRSNRESKPSRLLREDM